MPWLGESTEGEPSAFGVLDVNEVDGASVIEADEVDAPSEIFWENPWVKPLNLEWQKNTSKDYKHTHQNNNSCHLPAFEWTHYSVIFRWESL